jgi:hypothetical protein
MVFNTEGKRENLEDHGIIETPYLKTATVKNPGLSSVEGYTKSKPYPTQSYYLDSSDTKSTDC